MTRDRMRALLLARDQETAHFTASALVVDASRTRTALVHRRKLGQCTFDEAHRLGEDSVGPLIESARATAKA